MEVFETLYCSDHIPWEQKEDQGVILETPQKLNEKERKGGFIRNTNLDRLSG